MRNTQRDSLEWCSSLLPISKWDYPEWDVFMCFAFLFLSPARRFISQYSTPLLLPVSEVGMLTHSAQESLMLPVPAREMLKVYTLREWKGWSIDQPNFSFGQKANPWIATSWLSELMLLYYLSGLAAVQLGYLHSLLTEANWATRIIIASKHKK